MLPSCGWSQLRAMVGMAPMLRRSILWASVVPETICRIQSNWKHYLEFGNTFAFKPKYYLENGHLKLQENPMQNEIDFLNYREKLPLIQSSDRFYKEKFRKFQFRFPYTISFFRNLNRNIKLFHALFKRAIKRMLGQSDAATGGGE